MRVQGLTWPCLQGWHVPPCYLFGSRKRERLCVALVLWVNRRLWTQERPNDSTSSNAFSWARNSWSAIRSLDSHGAESTAFHWGSFNGRNQCFQRWRSSTCWRRSTSRCWCGRRCNQCWCLRRCNQCWWLKVQSVLVWLKVQSVLVWPKVQSVLVATKEQSVQVKMLVQERHLEFLLSRAKKSFEGQSFSILKRSLCLLGQCKNQSDGWVRPWELGWRRWWLKILVYVMIGTKCILRWLRWGWR